MNSIYRLIRTIRAIFGIRIPTFVYTIKYAVLKGGIALVVGVICSPAGLAQYDLEIVEQDLQRVNQVFHTAFNLGSIASVIDLGPEVVSVSDSDDERLAQVTFTPSQYIGYFLSKDSIEYISEQVLLGLAPIDGSDHAYRKKREFFDSLVAMILWSDEHQNSESRRDLIYRIVQESVSDAKVSQGCVAHHLLRSLVYQYLKAQNEYPLDRLLDPTPHQLNFGQNGLCLFQPQISMEFERQNLAFYVLRDLMVDWKNAYDLPEADRGVKMQEILSLIRRFKAQILRKEPFPSQESLQRVLQYYFNLDSVQALLADMAPPIAEVPVAAVAPSFQSVTIKSEVAVEPDSKKAKSARGRKKKQAKVAEPAPVEKPYYYDHFGKKFLLPQGPDHDFTPMVLEEELQVKFNTPGADAGFWSELENLQEFVPRPGFGAQDDPILELFSWNSEDESP